MTSSFGPSARTARENYIARRVEIELAYAGTPLAQRPFTTLSPAQAWRSRTWFRRLMIVSTLACLVLVPAVPPLLLPLALLIIVAVAGRRRDTEVAERVRVTIELREREAGENALREASRYLTAEDRAWFAANNAQIQMPPRSPDVSAGPTAGPR